MGRWPLKNGATVRELPHAVAVVGRPLEQLEVVARPARVAGCSRGARSRAARGRRRRRRGARGRARAGRCGRAARRGSRAAARSRSRSLPSTPSADPVVPLRGTTDDGVSPCFDTIFDGVPTGFKPSTRCGFAAHPVTPSSADADGVAARNHKSSPSFARRRSRIGAARAPSGSGSRCPSLPSRRSSLTSTDARPGSRRCAPRARASVAPTVSSSVTRVALRLDDPLEHATPSPVGLAAAASPSVSSPSRASCAAGCRPAAAHLRVGVAAPVARDLAGLVLVVQEPERALGLEAALDEPVDELLRLVGSAGCGDAEAERRVRGDDVDLVLVAERDERVACFGVGERELAPRPLEHEHVVRERRRRPRSRSSPRASAWNRDGGPSFSMTQKRTGRGTGMPSQSTPAARCAMPSIVHVLLPLPSAP